MEQVIIGAGGYAREIETQIGRKMKKFVDDEFFKVNNENIYPLSQFNYLLYSLIICIGDYNIRRKIVEYLHIDTEYFTFIHPSAQIIDKDTIKIGRGSIIGPNCIMTTNIFLGEHAQLNLTTTIGHDCVIGKFFTTAPGAKISGNCEFGENVYIGTNSSVREKIKICDNVVIGLNSGVVKNIEISGIYGGTPSKLIKEL